MRRLLNIGTNESLLDLLSLVLRVSIAAFMLTHGLGKLNLLFSGNEIQFADPFAKKEFALLYLIIYLVIFVIGSRKYSLDALLLKKI